MPAFLIHSFFCRLFLLIFVVVFTGCASSPTATLGPVKKAELVDRALAKLNFSTGRVVVKQPQDGDSERHVQLGESALQRGDSLAALRSFVYAMAVMPADSPVDSRVHLPLARLLWQLRRPEAAEAVLRTAVDSEAQAGDASRELARVLAALGRRQEAIDLLLAVVREQPSDGVAHARLAVELAFFGDVEGASHHLDSARALGSAIPEALPRLLAAGSQKPGRGSAASLGETLVGPAVRVDAGNGQAVETAVAGTGPELVAAWNDQRDGAVSAVWRLGAAASDDGGVTFFQGGSVFVARRQPGNATFDPPILAAQDANGFYDKPLMAVGRGPGNPNSTRLYITYSEGLQSSADLGQTWGPVVPIPTGEIYYQPRVGPDGVLSIISWDSFDSIGLRRSLDGGATVGPRLPVATRMDVWGVQEASRVPGEFRVPPLPSLAIAPDGTLHVVYCDTTAVIGDNADLDLYLTSSSNGGATWTAPKVLNGDAPFVGDQFAPWLEIDGTGRMHLAFFDTRYHEQDDDAPFGLVDVTYAFSDDHGATWHETRVTETSSSSADALWVGGSVPDYQFLGDYLGMTISAQGDPLVVYGAAPGSDYNIYSRRLGPPIFVDGFESGGTDAWALAVGGV